MLGSWTLYDHCPVSQVRKLRFKKKSHLPEATQLKAANRRWECRSWREYLSFQHAYGSWLNLSVFVCLFFFFFFLLVFQDRVSLYSPGCPGTYSVDQAGLELRNLSASASQVLGLKVCPTTAQLHFFLDLFYYFISMSVLLACIVCSMCMPRALGDRKRALDPLGLELQMV